MNHKLVVIIPALNEERTIENVIRDIPSRMEGIDRIEVLVIDDGSRDATSQIAQRAGAVVVRHPNTMGVGAAFHTGIRQALIRDADIIVNVDGDGQFNAHDIPELIAPILKQDAWFVSCTRFGNPKLKPKMPLMKYLGNMWMNRIINWITGMKFTDVSCGFRAYTRDAAMRLILFGHFTYTQETFIDLANKKVPMVEVPLKVQGEREHGRSRVASSLWRYGIKSASIIFRTMRDYHPLTFFGLPGVILFAIGSMGGIFLLVHWIQTGQTYPYRSLVQLSSVLLILGFLLAVFAMLADMIHRNRLLIEQIVYLTRKNVYDNEKKSRN